MAELLFLIREGDAELLYSRVRTSSKNGEKKGLFAFVSECDLI